MKPSESKSKATADEAPPRLRVWGLTGGVASGKSTAARFFAEAGIPVVDADQISRSLSAEGGAARPAILARFGTAERARLREIVFADPGARRDLEAILHPLIRQESFRQLRALAEAEALRRGTSIDRVPLLYEAALLVEAGRIGDFEGLVVVTAPVDMRRSRLIARDGSTSDVADGILRAQFPEEKRLAAATYVLHNAGTADALRHEVNALAQELLTRTVS